MPFIVRNPADGIYPATDDYVQTLSPDWLIEIEVIAAA